MPVTDFPNGASSFGTVIQTGVSSITGAGTITTSLDTITGVVCSLGTALGTATNEVWTVMGTANTNVSAASTFITRVYAGNEAAGTVAAPVHWIAVGTKDA